MLANDFLNYMNVRPAGGSNGTGTSTVVLIVVGVVIAARHHRRHHRDDGPPAQAPTFASDTPGAPS